MASVGVQNFTASQTIVTDGLSIYKYETAATIDIDSKAQFDAQTYTNSSFTAAKDDLVAVVDTDDFVQLNHYGDNQPDNTDDWWDDDADASTLYDWRYRKCMTVDLTDADASSTDEYQLYLDIDTATLVGAGKMLASGDDIRFVDSAGSSLDYYIADDMNSASTRVWVKANSIAAASSDNICMYYGYTGAGALAAGSNRDATFTYATQQPIYSTVSNRVNAAGTDYTSYIDGNEVDIETSSDLLDRGEGTSFPTVGSATLDRDDVILTSGPLSGSYNVNGMDNIVPASAAGTDFSYAHSRGTNAFYIYSPYCSATIDMVNQAGNTINGSPFTVAAGATLTVTTNDTATDGIPNNGSLVTEEQGSDCPFYMYHSATNGSDSYPLYPAANEWYGVGSGSYYGTALENGTNVTVYRSGIAAPSTYSLSKGQVFSSNDSGSQGSENAHRVVADKPIGVNAVADGDGSDGVTFMPFRELGYKYFAADLTEYFAVATEAGKTTVVDVYTDGTSCGVGPPDYTQTATATGDRPGKALFNAANMAAGSCVIADNLMYVYNEYDDSSDEHNIWSEKQNRQFAVNPPTTSAGAVQTGSWSLGSATTFTRRVPVTITNPGAAINQFQVDINLDTLPAAIFTDPQNDGGDIWLAGATGGGADNLVYRLEGYNKALTQGRIWTKVTLGSSSSTTVYVYYNSTATVATSSDISAVFKTTTRKPNYYIVNDYGLAGATLSLVAHADGTSISDGLNTAVVNEGEFTNYPVAPPGTSLVDTSEYLVTGPLSIGFNSDASDSAAPIGYAGYRFSVNAARGTDSYSIKAPFADAAIVIQSSTGTTWTTIHSSTVLAGTVSQIIQNVGNGDAIRIISDEPVMVVHTADNSDSKVLYPEEQALEQNSGLYELYGIGSNSIFVTTSADTTASITIYRSDNTTTTAVLNAANNYTWSENGAGAQGLARSYRITSDEPISGFAYADSDGSEAETILPRKEMSNEYYIVRPTQYVAIAAIDPGVTCRMYNELGVEVTSGAANNSPQTGGVLNMPFPNKIFFGGSSTGDPAYYQQGYRVSCTEPVYAYYEHAIDGTINDETNFLSWPQGRQNTRRAPIVDSVNTALEQGLYFESGFDQNTTDLIPDSYVEIDLGAPFGSDIFWGNLSATIDLPSLASANGVSPYQVQFSAVNSATCSTATYPAFSAETALTTSTPVPNGFNDKNCLRARILLRTGDPAYTPQLFRVQASYSVPVLLGDQFNVDTITLPANSFASPVGATSSTWRALKIESSDPGLNLSKTSVTYRGAGNTSKIIDADISLYDPLSLTTFVQHNWPVTDPPPVQGDTEADLSNTDGLYLDIDYAKEISASGSSIDLTIRSEVPGATDGIVITRDFTIRLVD